MKWKCTVCNYIHEGDEPPDICPVCNKPKDAFERLDEDPQEETAEEPTRQWYCTVCRYIHTGDSPPDTCPVCKKPWTAFVPHEEGQEHPPPARPAKKPAPHKEKANRWRCVVCNYIHEGPQPPDICPVCGKGKEFFQAETDSPEHHHEGLSGLIEKLHLHPVSAHMPNGALPLALLAWAAFLVTGEASLERTSFYLVFVAMAAAPLTFFTGWSDARHRFGSTTTGIFPEKKLWSWVLMAVAVATVVWRLAIGWNDAPTGGLEIAVFSSFLLVGNVLTARLGMLGGKLVFGH